MAVKSGKPIMQRFYTVEFEEPSKRTGKMRRQVSSCVEDLGWFRAHVKKRGGKIISESGPRMVETIPITF